MDSATDTRRMKAILTLAAAVAFASSPLWTSGFNGFTADQFPIPQDSPPVQPAGYAFSIWGVIYLWLLVSAGFGLLRRAGDPAWDGMRMPLIISLVVGAAWLPVAQVSVLWASAMIWGMLATALIALNRSPRHDRWWAQAPVALYAGWLTAASSVSIGLVGAGFGVFGLGEVLWAIIAVLIALWVTGKVSSHLRRAPEYGVAVAWALVGVLVANLAGGSWIIAVLAVLGIFVTAILSLRNISDWS